MRTRTNPWFRILILAIFVIAAATACSISSPTDDQRTAVDIAQEWRDLYYKELGQLQNMTGAGFLTPRPVQQQQPGGAVFIDGWDLDWSHPIGFAVTDCDHRPHMVDGSIAVTIRWDPARRCLIAVDSRDGSAHE
jgi:hypothetical protein